MHFFIPHSFIFLCIFQFLVIADGCQHSVTGNKKNYSPQGDQADLAYNPMRADGSIDSSYLPILKLTESEFDFGVIEEGEVLKHDFEVRNTGTAPLMILQATSSCGCTIPKFPTEPIEPGESDMITIKFNSHHKEGYQNKQVTIFANTIPNQTIIRIKAKVEKSK